MPIATTVNFTLWPCKSIKALTSTVIRGNSSKITAISWACGYRTRQSCKTWITSTTIHPLISIKSLLKATNSLVKSTFISTSWIIYIPRFCAIFSLPSDITRALSVFQTLSVSSSTSVVFARLVWWKSRAGSVCLNEILNRYVFIADIFRSILCFFLSPTSILRISSNWSK